VLKKARNSFTDRISYSLHYFYFKKDRIFSSFYFSSPLFLLQVWSERKSLGYDLDQAKQQTNDRDRRENFIFITFVSVSFCMIIFKTIIFSWNPFFDFLQIAIRTCELKTASFTKMFK